MIEAAALTALIMLMASLVTPSFVHILRARTLTDFRDRLPDVVAKARETAITRGSAVDLQYDQNARELQIVAAASQDTSGVPTSAAALNAGDAPLFTVSLPTGIDGANYQNPPETTANTAWSVRFYPDGTAAPAGMQFAIGDDSYSTP